MIDLRLGDCLEVMRDLPDGSVDAVVTDPPYETTFAGGRKKQYAQELQARQWVGSFMWVQDVARVLKTGGAWYVSMNDEGWSSLLATAKMHDLHRRARLVWIKTNPVPARTYDGWRSATELIMYGVKGASASYFRRGSQQDLLPYFFYPVVAGRERTPHPTQKPVALITRFIETSCPPGGTVLDPFMGSGTTGVACVNTGRSFIGIEKDEGYFQIARDRIHKAQDTARQLPLEVSA